MRKSDIKIISRNKKAFHDYELLEKFEAGIELKGGEIKSIRAGKVNIKDGYVKIINGEAYLVGINIPEYQKGNFFSKYKADRIKKLLLHKKEIQKISSRILEKGLTAVITSIYLKDGFAKAEIYLAKGKKLFDKRKSIAKEDSKRDLEREIVRKYKKSKLTIK